MKKLIIAAVMAFSATNANAQEMPESAIKSSVQPGYMVAINKYLHDDIANQIKMAQAEGQMITASDAVITVDTMQDSSSDSTLIK